MAFQGYLAEEVAIDHADGLYSRREALRRLALLGLGVPAATALLAACGGDGEPALSTTGAGEAAAPPTPAVDTQEITFPGPEGRTVRGAWAAADQPRGAVLVIHENRGLNDHIRSVAGRLAASGYSALAIDLLSAEGRPLRRPPGAVRGRHASRPGRARAPGPRPEARLDRVLLRRRHGLAAARLR
jgi:carboxymethylenebutenolidase